MYQSTLFDTERIELKDANLRYFSHFLSVKQADELFIRLKEKTLWQERTITMYGKVVEVPRLSAWYGDANAYYQYSNIEHLPFTWTQTLLDLKRQIVDTVGVSFNSVLLNLYRDEKDSVSWHSDDEPELGSKPVIASLSLGESRTFQLKHLKVPNQSYSIELGNGSLLVMAGDTQRLWQHRIPKVNQLKKERINLTFRYIYPDVISVC